MGHPGDSNQRLPVLDVAQLGRSDGSPLALLPPGPVYVFFYENKLQIFCMIFTFRGYNDLSGEDISRHRSAETGRKNDTGCL